MKTYFRKTSCIVRQPTNRTIFESLRVRLEQGSPVEWISVDDCQKILVEHQFIDLFLNIESRSLEKITVLASDIIQDQIDLTKSICRTKLKTERPPIHRAITYTIMSAAYLNLVAVVAVLSYLIWNC